MAYMLLILEPHGQRAERTEQEDREAYARMVQFGQALASRSLLLASESMSEVRKLTPCY